MKQLGDFELCDGRTLSELEHAKTVSDSCKAELSAYLPPSTDNFSGRVLVLGQEPRDDGSLRVFVASSAVDEPTSTFGSVLRGSRSRSGRR